MDNVHTLNAKTVVYSVPERWIGPCSSCIAVTIVSLSMHCVGIATKEFTHGSLPSRGRLLLVTRLAGYVISGVVREIHQGVRH